MQDIANHKILIVDDSATTRIVIRRILRLTGVEDCGLFDADNGADGLQLMRSHAFDLVLADLNMPIMGGVEMIRQMATENQLKNVPIFVLSAHPDRRLLTELKQFGVRGYLSKPFTAENVRDMLFPCAEGDAAKKGVVLNPNAVRRAIESSLAEAMETTAFICPESAANISADFAAEPLLRVCIKFGRGDSSGLLELLATRQFCSVLLSSMVGEDVSMRGPDPTFPLDRDAFKELANVTCGLLLRKHAWVAPGSQISLDLPTLASADGAQGVLWVNEWRLARPVVMVSEAGWVAALLTLPAA